MSTTTKTQLSPAPKSTTLAPREEMEQFEQTLHERIARRAFSIFEESGRPHGEHLRHWLQAETETLYPPPEIRESRDSVTVVARMPDHVFGNPEICLGNRRAIIRAKAKQSPPSGSDKQESDRYEETFALAQWPPWEIDPATASAYLDGNLLTVTAKKLRPASTAATGA